MRLLNTTTHRLESFPDERGVTYAILSHRWDQDEILFEDITATVLSRSLLGNRYSYFKIRNACGQAKHEGYDWVWIDTCCIDKSSSAELQEAINSMFRWYKNAEVCYVYMNDVFPNTRSGKIKNFEQSKWFKRGWTLQELLAPNKVVFYGKNWEFIGTKFSMCQSISSATKIPAEILTREFLADGSVNVAEIMSWARGRETTRIEDRAYSMLGLFNVNMPMLYGEGEKAFFRLQKKILKNSEDQSIFYWTGKDVGKPGLLAPSPDYFTDSSVSKNPQSRVYLEDIERRQPSTITSEHISIEVELIPWAPNIYLALLNVPMHSAIHPWNTYNPFGIFLRPVDKKGRYARVHNLGFDIYFLPEDEFSCEAHLTNSNVPSFSFTKRAHRMAEVKVVHELRHHEFAFVEEIQPNTCLLQIKPWSQNSEQLELRRHFAGQVASSHHAPDSTLGIFHKPGAYGWLASLGIGKPCEETGPLQQVSIGVTFDFCLVIGLVFNEYDEFDSNIREFMWTPQLDDPSYWEPININVHEKFDSVIKRTSDELIRCIEFSKWKSSNSDSLKHMLREGTSLNDIWKLKNLDRHPKHTFFFKTARFGMSNGWKMRTNPWIPGEDLDSEAQLCIKVSGFNPISVIVAGNDDWN